MRWAAGIWVIASVRDLDVFGGHRQAGGGTGTFDKSKNPEQDRHFRASTRRSHGRAVNDPGQSRKGSEVVRRNSHVLFRKQRRYCCG